MSDDSIESIVETINTIADTISKDFIGQSQVIEQVLIALISNGHVLIEGVPGLGKTLLVQSLARCFSGEYKRIQFTPDLMPSDVTGHVMYDMNEGKFRIRKGPVFTNILLADEINRAPAKTQASLLEVMQERQVTLEGSTQPLPFPFMVMATQNPIEQEGTYPLPEAELDRFLIKVLIDYPSQEDEIAITKNVTYGKVSDATDKQVEDKVITTDVLQKLQKAVSLIDIDDQVYEYAVNLVRATRESPSISGGASTRACIALIRCAKAYAVIKGRTFVTPDDIKHMALPTMRHRISVAPEIEIEGSSSDEVLSAIINRVEAPRI